MRCSKCGRMASAEHECPKPRAEKTCTSCGLTQPTSNFPLRKSHNGKRYPGSLCAGCRARAVAKWAKSNPEKRAKTIKAHREANRLKYRCRAVTRYAVQSGKIQQGPCEKCGAEKVQAHHQDYAKPLDVRWLCSQCHGKEHRIAAA